MAFSLSRQTPIIGTRTQTPLPATASQQRLIGGPTCLQRSKPRSGRRSLQGLQRAVHSPVPGDASRSNAPFAEGILSRLSDDEDSTGKSVGPGNLPDDSSGALISASPGEGPSIPEGRLSWESDSEGSDAAAASSAGRTGNVAPASLQDASSSSSSKRGIGAATVLPAPYAISIMPEGMMSRTGTFSEDEEEEPVLQASTTAVSSKVTNGGVAAAVQGSASGIPEGMLSRVSSDSDPEPQVVADAEPHASCMHAAPSPPPEDSAIPEGMLSRVDSDSDAQADAEPHVGMHASARKLSQDPPQESAVPEGMLSLEDKGTPPPSADGSGGSIFESSLPEGMLSRADSEDEVATQSAAAADTHRPVASHEEETVTSQAEQAVANQACETVVDQVETAGADQEEKAMASHEENRVGLTVELPTVMYRFNSNGTVTQIAANGSSSSHPNRSVSSAALLAHPCLVSMPRSAASAPMQPLTASVLQCGRSFGAMQLTSQVISRQRMRSVMRAAPFKDDSTQQQQQHTIDAITGAAHSGQGNVDTREGSGISMQGTPRASYDSLQDGANNIQPLPAFVTSAIDRHRNALARVQSRLNQLANSNLLDISPPISRTSNATVCEGLLSENSQAGNALTATAFSPADSDSAGHDDELAREITAVRSLLSELRELAANVSDPDGPLSSETSYAAALMVRLWHIHARYNTGIYTL